MTSRRKLRARWRKNSTAWRRRHPLRDAWRCHRWNARQRGIPSEWTFEEFAIFCRMTGYHILRRDGYVIHRVGDAGPYQLERCFCIRSQVNRRLEAVNLKIKRYRLAKYMSEQ